MGEIKEGGQSHPIGTPCSHLKWQTPIRLNFNPFSKTPTAEDWSRGPGGEDEAFFSPLPLEPDHTVRTAATFPSGIRLWRQTTVAAPGTLKPEGVAAPFHLNGKTGFVTVRANIDGVVYPLGNRQRRQLHHVSFHYRLRRRGSDWLRSIGAIGEANYLMMPIGPEAKSTSSFLATP